ncbi:hypothetical protein BJF79_09510 [Actinomadura sp. CNU-125]|nr:hypothetical protein BJF79_09510 [Actinomadura sp. CNU-125]
MMTNGAAILGAIATQVQAAEMARDIKAIRQAVNDIFDHLQSDQKGAVKNVVEQVEDLVAQLREYGKGDIEASRFAIITNSLGDARHKCMEHLSDAVRKLEHAAQQGNPHQAQRVSEGAVEGAMLYLDLLGKVYAASVQLGLARVALAHHENDPDGACTHTELTTKYADRFRTEIEDVHNQLGRLEESLRALFRPERGNWVLPAVRATPGAFCTARQLAGTRMIRVPGVPAPIPVATVAAVATLIPSVAGGVDARVQSHAEKKLDDRLGQLTAATNRISRIMDQAATSLQSLRTLTEELAGPGESVR